MNCAETFQPSLPAALPRDACFAIVAPAGAARLDTHKVNQWGGASIELKLPAPQHAGEIRQL